jgi:hypothetical protein
MKHVAAKPISLHASTALKHQASFFGHCGLAAHGGVVQTAHYGGIVEEASNPW